MKPEVQTIIDAASNSISDAIQKCTEFIETTKNDFLEQLSVNSATDFIGSVLLISKLFASEKKPWKAIPFLDEVYGAVCFLNDYIQDRAILSETCVAVASAYEYANFFPEAKKYYQRALEFNSNSEASEDTIYSYLLMCLFAEDNLNQEFTKDLSKRFDRDLIQSLKNEARSSYENSIKTDPIEREENFLSIRYELEKEIDQILLSQEDQDTPFCLRYWKEKKRVLKEKYSLDWKTPAELNPQINFC